MAFKRRLRFDKRIRFRKSMSIMYILLFVVLASLGVGYSYIKSNLNINGTANVTAANWDVHFTNLNVTTGSVTASSPASITNPTTVTFAATLDEPNDYYEFTVDVVNAGTIDAMIDSVNISPTLTTAQQKYLHYDIAYYDSLPLNPNQILPAGATEKIKVTFFYSGTELIEEMPTEDQSFNMSFSINCVQADNTAVEHRSYVYSLSKNLVKAGDNISSLGTSYSSYQTLVDVNSSEVFLRHRIDNNYIGESSVGFINNNNVYYLIGGNSNTVVDIFSYAVDSIYYEQNKETLLSAFGSSNCTVGTYGTECELSNLSAYIEKSGYVNVSVRNSGNCKITFNNESRCEGCFGAC